MTPADDGKATAESAALFALSPAHGVTALRGIVGPSLGTLWRRHGCPRLLTRAVHLG